MKQNRFPSISMAIYTMAEIFKFVSKNYKKEFKIAFFDIITAVAHVLSPPNLRPRGNLVCNMN